MYKEQPKSCTRQNYESDLIKKSEYKSFTLRFRKCKDGFWKLHPHEPRAGGSDFKLGANICE